MLQALHFCPFFFFFYLILYNRNTARCNAVLCDVKKSGHHFVRPSREAVNANEQKRGNASQGAAFARKSFNARTK